MRDERVVELLDNRKFQDLFVDELGWNRPQGRAVSALIDGVAYELRPVAAYKSVQVWSCDGRPSSRVQRELDRVVSKQSVERLIVFADDDLQQWRWPMNGLGAAGSCTKLVTHEYRPGQSSPSLLERLSLIEIPTGASPTLSDILARLRKAFDADKLTKSFYREYFTQHADLVNAIEGITLESDRAWYGSLLMNRLMFIYFLQWKGFMDADRDYLRNRMARVREYLGPDRFYDFYASFLLPLFHSGLGSGQFDSGDSAIVEIAGRVPYVNGGIFAEHVLELSNNIRIPDSAFEKIFAFFDSYQWHLDDRPSGNPREINPDVLGYIFEQFINNKEKGAYYTKEDVTDYMTVNSVSATFLDRLASSTGVNPWKRLTEDPTRYIRESLSYGLGTWKDRLSDLDFAVGQQPMDSKQEAEVALPGETGWEICARLERYEVLVEEIRAGKIASVSDAISKNLDLETLVVDVLDGLDSPEDVNQAWIIARSLTIVDPTCGSGAFLFSAMKRLEVIFEAILQAAVAHLRTSTHQGLQKIVDAMYAHASPRYFILKKIAQDNLYGVDLMPEASEIARLRLFLKLMAVIERFEDIEPLPDLEFNIKSGNLLMGATRRDLVEHYASTFEARAILEDAVDQSDHLADLWELFEAEQESADPTRIKLAKKSFETATKFVSRTLDRIVFEADSSPGRVASLEEWASREQQFHWFIEFPQVFAQGGFDVVVGNPPYIGIKKKNALPFSVHGHETSGSPDLYALCLERASFLVNARGTMAMIVMHSLCFSEDYQALRRVLRREFPARWLSSFGRIPSCLFTNETRVRNTILIGRREPSRRLMGARLHRWISDFRPHLMATIFYNEVPEQFDEESSTWPFMTDRDILDVMRSQGGSLGLLTRSVRGRTAYDADGDGYLKEDSVWGLNYKTTMYNYMPVFVDIPDRFDVDGNSVEQSEMKTLWFTSRESRDLALTLTVGMWGFFWWMTFGDDFHLTAGLLARIPVSFDKIAEDSRVELLNLSVDLREAMRQNPTVKKNKGEIYNWHIPSCRDITDRCDEVWAREFGASDLLPRLKWQRAMTVRTDNDDSEEDEVD